MNWCPYPLLTLLLTFGSFNQLKADCTQEIITHLENMRSLSFKVSKGIPYHDYHLDRETLLNGFQQDCFDSDKAYQLNYLWQIYLNSENKQIQDERFFSLALKKLKILQTHGHLEQAQKVYDAIKKSLEKVPNQKNIQLGQRPEVRDRSACQDIDISEKMPVVRNQGSMGWCSHFSYADLLSYELNQTLSASYLGFILRPSGKLGSLNSNISTLNDTIGFCTEKALPSRLPKRYGPKRLQFIQNPDKIAKTYPGNDPLDLLDNWFKELFPESMLQTVHEIHRLNDPSPILILDRKYQINPSYGDQYSDKIVSSIAYEVCKEQNGFVRVNDLNFTTYHFNERYYGKSPIATVDDALKAGKPALIRYEVSAVAEGSNYGKHASVVVGRRFKNNQCQYLIRNSWGKNSCLKTKGIQGEDFCSPAGHFWVNIDTLSDTLTSVEFIEQQSAL